MPNAIDLVDLDQVKSYLASSGTAPVNTSDDANIQSCITAFSMGLILWTNRGNQDGSVPAGNPFLEAVTYTDTYDGNGHEKLFLKNSPIQTITSLQIGPTVMPLSTGFSSFGGAVGGTRDYIYINVGGGVTASFDTIYPFSYPYFCRNIFPPGIQNIFVTYTAGFPGGTPPDIYQFALETIALNYMRKNWIGLQSKAMANGAGTTSYKDWEFNPFGKRTLMNYTNWALTS
jgi:hypothetical protein